MSMFLMALATAFTFAILKWKLQHGRKADAFLDMGMTAILVFVLGHSAEGGAMAMISSALISIYLIFDPLIINVPKIERRTINKISYTLIAIAVIIICAYIALKFI